jgi:Zn-dependent M16 (insulinase) family peptidase
MMNMGLNIADGRLQSYYSESGKYGDLQALPLYKFVVELDNNFTKRADEITKNLKEVAGLVFNKKNLVASVTCDSEEYSIYQKSLKEFTSNLADNEVKTQVYKFEESTKNEGIMSTSQVQYIANGYDFTKLGYEYSGKMLVLKSVLDGEYIWNRVRELGGAYGGAFNVTPNGNAEFLSWSDPNLKETIDIFNKAGDYIKNFSASQKDIDNYVISTIGGLDKPMSPSEKGRCSDYGYFSGVTQQDIQKERDEVLSTKVEDIKYYGDMLSKITGQNEYCVFGNGAKINDNKDIFNSTIDVMGN